MRHVVAALAALACVGALAGSATDDTGTLLQHADFNPAPLALAIEDREYLGYALDALPRVRRIDIDDDGIPDNFVIAADSLCGTGGCPVLLLDGRSGHRLGEFFGAVAVLHRRNRGHAVIQVASRRDAELTGIETHAFDGRRYLRTAHELFDAEAMAAWRARIETR